MRAELTGVLTILSLGCAHTPERPYESQTDVYLARSLQFAIRGVEPAPAYEVLLPTNVSSKRVLALAANHSGLALAKPGILRRTDAAGQGAAQVRIVLQPPEWIGPSEALVRFSFGTASGVTTSCSVQLRPDAASSDSWAFRPIGEEHCWPRPSRQPPS